MKFTWIRPHVSAIGSRPELQSTSFFESGLSWNPRILNETKNHIFLNYKSFDFIMWRSQKLILGVGVCECVKICIFFKKAF